MCDIIIKNVKIVNEGKVLKNSGVLLRNGSIEKIFRSEIPENVLAKASEVIDGSGKYLLPGVIDDQVHFREPGLTNKGEIYTEAKAGVAGGITSFMEMPNTKPQATTLEELEKKYDRASDVSLANYSFYLGATNDNLEEILKADPTKICGLKVFMGSSTGNMLVDDTAALSALFEHSKMLITTHCEDEESIRANTAKAKEEFGEDVPIAHHPVIRSAEACFKSTSRAVELAKKFGTRLHVLHLSTKQEMALFEAKPLKEKHITAEVCVHHLWFSDKDYEQYGTRIKWNPAIKSESDRDALRQALRDCRIDVVATDHAPHTKEEKDNKYFKAPSGGPLVQHSLPAMLELTRKGVFSLEEVVEKMCHNPADLYAVEKRGYIRKGYKADLVLVEANPWTVASENIYYKCGWSPFEGETFNYRVTHTIVNGNIVYTNDNGTEIFNEGVKGERLSFNR